MLKRFNIVIRSSTAFTRSNIYAQTCKYATETKKKAFTIPEASQGAYSDKRIILLVGAPPNSTLFDVKRIIKQRYADLSVFKNHVPSTLEIESIKPYVGETGNCTFGRFFITLSNASQVNELIDAEKIYKSPDHYKNMLNVAAQPKKHLTFLQPTEFDFFNNEYYLHKRFFGSDLFEENTKDWKRVKHLLSSSIFVETPLESDSIVKKVFQSYKVDDILPIKTTEEENETKKIYRVQLEEPGDVLKMMKETNHGTTKRYSKLDAKLDSSLAYTLFVE